MSEVLSVKLTNREKETFEPAMPAGYEVFDRIETTTDENGEPSRTNGILIIGGGDNQYERKVQLDLDKDWAIDLEERKSYLADPEAWEKERRLETLAKQVEDLIAQNSKLEKRVAGLEAELAKGPLAADFTASVAELILEGLHCHNRVNRVRKLGNAKYG